MKEPVISIIIPLYNKEKTISRTINSVLSQSFYDSELIIVDDGSTDNSVDVVKKFNHRIIKLYTKPNGGPSSARNLGLDKATGEWIMFLDADDELKNEALIRIARILNSDPNIEVLACNFQTRIGNRVQTSCASLKEGFVVNPYRENALGRLSLRAGAAVFKADKIKNIRFDEKLRRFEDFAFNLKIFESLKIYRTSTTVLIYDRNESEASKPRKNPDEDYLCHLQMKHRPFFYGLIIYRMYKSCTRLYPEVAAQRYNSKDFNLLRYRIVDLLIRICKRLRLI